MKVRKNRTKQNETPVSIVTCAHS